MAHNQSQAIIATTSTDNNIISDTPLTDNSQTDSQPRKRTRTRTSSVGKPASANVPPQVMDEILNKTRYDIENNPNSIINQLKAEVSQLHSIISSQSAEISRLSKQLSVVMSYLELTDTNQASTSSSTSASVTVDQSGTSSSSSSSASPDAMDDSTPFTVVTTKNKRSQPTARAAAVTAIYLEQNDKKRRSSSVIVSGLPPATAPGAPDDRQLFLGFCQAEFNIYPEIVATKRLGKPRPDRVQPLLVACRSEEIARQLITMAPSLRHSSNEYVRAKVYVNANLTPAEAAAAFQLRERRRQSAATRVTRTQQTTQQQATTMTPGPHDLTAPLLLPPAPTPVSVQSSTSLTAFNFQQPTTSYANNISLTNIMPSAGLSQ